MQAWGLSASSVRRIHFLDTRSEAAVHTRVPGYPSCKPPVYFLLLPFPTNPSAAHRIHLACSSPCAAPKPLTYPYAIRRILASALRVSVRSMYLLLAPEACAL